MYMLTHMRNAYMPTCIWACVFSILNGERVEEAILIEAGGQNTRQVALHFSVVRLSLLQ